tara:strand:+ start:957 stop:1211 length:255 start_codon:yes stop_codon:yes gene_type:complete
MKKQINDLLLKMQNGENCIGETANKLLDLYSVSITLPNKNATICEGYNKAKMQDYQNRNVLRHKDKDDYYSGWMDCYDWISKGN